MADFLLLIVFLAKIACAIAAIVFMVKFFWFSPEFEFMVENGLTAILFSILSRTSNDET